MEAPPSGIDYYILHTKHDYFFWLWRYGYFATFGKREWNMATLMVSRKVSNSFLSVMKGWYLIRNSLRCNGTRNWLFLFLLLGLFYTNQVIMSKDDTMTGGGRGQKQPNRGWRIQWRSSKKYDNSLEKHAIKLKLVCKYNLVHL